MVIDSHLVFLGLFVIVLIFWVMLNKLINKLLDVLERKNADHHRG